MSVNKNHPDYDEYIEKCKDITKKMEKEKNKVISENPIPRKAFDGPESIVHKKYALELKKLQKEYHYLFTEEE